MGRKSIVLDKTDCDYVREKYKYDPDTGLIVFRTTTGLKAGKITGTSKEKGGYHTMFVSLPSGRRGLKVHLVAWLLWHGVWPEHEVDHADQDKSNNKIRNLKRATGSQNRANIRKYKTSSGKPTSSQYKGVSWVKRDQLWLAYIRVDKKLINLGTFKNEREAAYEYDTAAMRHYGDRAVLNFPSSNVATLSPSGQGDVRLLSNDE